MKESESMASSGFRKPWSETRTGRSVLMTGMIGLFALVFWMGVKSRQMISPALVIDEQYLSFGEVWEDRGFSWILPIHNTTNEDINIDGFAADCSCVRIDPHSFTIPAQETVNVQLILDLRSHSKNGAVRGAREFKVSVKPHISKGSRTHEGWTVRGRVKRPIAIEPTMVDFGADLVQGQTYPMKIVTTTANVPIEDLHAKCPLTMGIVEVRKLSDRSRTFQLRITPHRSLPPGAFRFEVTLDPVGHYEGIPSISFPVEGVIIPEVQALPSSTCLGARLLGQTVTETVVLRSIRNEQVDVERIRVSDGDLTVEPSLEEKTGSKTFFVKQLISKQGLQARSIEFSIRNRDHEVTVTTVNVTYVGLPTKSP